MGMSASQARLLSLTARMSDLEIRSQRLTNSKVRLANASEAASREYTESLSKQKVQMSTYRNGIYQNLDVTSEVLKDNNYRFRMNFTDSSGTSYTNLPAIPASEIPVKPTFVYSGNPSIPIAYAAARSIGAVVTFPTGYTYSMTQPSVPQPNYTPTQTTAPELIDSIATLTNTPTAQQTALLYAMGTNEAHYDMFSNLFNNEGAPVMNRDGGSEQTNSSSQTWFDKAFGNAINSGDIKVLRANYNLDATNTGSEGHVVGFQLKGSAASLAQTKGLPTCYTTIIDLMTALFGKDKMTEVYNECSSNTFNPNTMSNQFKTGNSITDVKGNVLVANINNADGTLGQALGLEFSSAYLDSIASYLSILADALTLETKNKNVGNAIRNQSGGEGDFNFNNTSTAFLLDYANKVETYENQLQEWENYQNYNAWMDYYVSCVFNEYDYFIDNDMAEYDEDYNEYLEKWCVKDYTKLVGDDARYYSAREIIAGNQLYAVLADPKYVAALLQYGTEGSLIIEQYQADQTWAAKTLAETTISMVHDESVDAVAEATYNSAVAKIKVKENQIDRELKKIETEHSAAEAEYDSVKSVIEKNMETSMKIFA